MSHFRLSVILLENRKMIWGAIWFSHLSLNVLRPLNDCKRGCRAMCIFLCRNGEISSRCTSQLCYFMSNLFSTTPFCLMSFYYFFAPHIFLINLFWSNFFYKIYLYCCFFPNTRYKPMPYLRLAIIYLWHYNFYMYKLDVIICYLVLC